MSTREELQALSHALLDAWVARKPEAAALSGSLRYTENGRVVAVGEGLWNTVTSLRFRWIIADTETQQVLGFAVLTEGEAPCLAAFRAHAQAGTWTEIE